ncbi:MAG: glycosyltransferase family 2 protein [Spirochaetes bacterium]|nr:glycosyltransferase family 2 protein [Spirochaetota bacterium]
MHTASVIIPAYNRAGMLQKAVESVLSQSDPPLELIVVDDGSSDGTAQYIDSLESGDLRIAGPDSETHRITIRCIRIPHSGVSRARNAGIEASRGEWIAFLDSDDYWLPKKLGTQLVYLKKHPDLLICHTDEIWIKNGIRINQGKKHKKKEGWFFIESLDLCLISPSSVMIHRSVFDRVGRFDESFDAVEDYDLWLRITSKYPVGYIDEKLVVKTGGHPDQLSARIDGIEGYRIRALEKCLLDKELRSDFYAEALRVYEKKCGIYQSGCWKRGKEKEAERVRNRMDAVIASART